MLPAPVKDALDQDPRWHAVQRVVSSPSFSKSNRLSGFLLYVCEKALAGHAEEITEQQIGIHVFGRPVDYDPGADNIVRGSARQLRQRLAVYYTEEGAEDEVRINIPKGAYVPVFDSATPKPASSEIEAEPAPAPASRAKWLWFLLVPALAVIALFIWLWPVSPSQRLWTTLFPSGQHTLVVPGDSGLVLLQNYTNTTVSTPDYASGAYRSLVASIDPASPFAVHEFGLRRYTSLSDLNFAVRLAQLPQAHQNLEIRFARNFHIEDLKRTNAILIGAPQGNPWVRLFEDAINFRILSDEAARTHRVINRSPKPGEQTEYLWSVNDPQRKAYTVLSFTQNLDRTGWVLVVQGTTGAGIDAAVDFLFNPQLLDAALAPATLNRSGLRPFDLLLETTHISNNGLGVRLLAARYY